MDKLHEGSEACLLNIYTSLSLARSEFQSILEPLLGVPQISMIESGSSYYLFGIVSGGLLRK